MEGEEVSGGRSCRVIVVFEVEENERLANNIETIDSEMNEPKRDSVSTSRPSSSYFLSPCPLDELSLTPSLSFSTLCSWRLGSRDVVVGRQILPLLHKNNYQYKKRGPVLHPSSSSFHSASGRESGIVPSLRHLVVIHSKKTELPLAISERGIGRALHDFQLL